MKLIIHKNDDYIYVIIIRLKYCINVDNIRVIPSSQYKYLYYYIVYVLCNNYYHTILLLSVKFIST